MKLTKQIAEKLLKSDDQELKDFALANFPELKVVRWENLPTIEYCYFINENSVVKTAIGCVRNIKKKY